MSGRHVQSLGLRVGRRWLVGAGALLIAAATALAIAPSADATAQTVNAQLSLSGVATKDNVLGGSQIGIHPGDTVDFKASALPTAGLENVPALGSLLNSLLSPLLGQYQVVVSFTSGFPGGSQTFTLGGPTSGKCKGVASKAVTFPKKDTYNFTWKVQYVLPILGGCAKNGLTDTNLGALKTAGVELNTSNSWKGQIVVADNPPKGGISVQLPGLSAKPKILGHTLPAINVPGVVAPTLHVPSVGNLLPSKTNGTKPAGGTSGGAANPTTGVKLPGLSIPDQVMPKGSGGFGNGGGGGFYLGDVPNSGSQLTNIAPGGTGSGKSSSGADLKTQDSSGKNKSIDLASSKASPSGQLPVVLAILAIIALALVAGTYARLFLLRRSS